ncbi:hypothetical protein ACFSSB_00405 [Lacinutrix gracilariae]|uniref:Uncharacterized protein n=1 Tax=Lacinutrix gracilariae TaxID=1747198 RepID=A0ABW5JVH1_9FLAO
MKYLEAADYSVSDDFIARNISCLIKLSWTEEEVKLRAEKMVAAITSVINK